MKKNPFSGLLLLGLLAAAFHAPSNPLVGRWQRKLANGTVLLANFRPDGSYDAFVNGKAFANGNYTLQQDAFTLSDGQCDLRYAGTYTLGFYSGTDSIRFTVVQDTCRDRRRAIDGLRMGRLTPAKR